MLEAVLLEGFFGYDEVFVAEAYLIFGERKVVVILRTVAGRGLFVGAGLPVFLFLLLGYCPHRVFIAFGTVQSTLFSSAIIAAA